MIPFYHFLDWLQSALNKSQKALRQRRKWGTQWRDMTRPGRHYSRVEFCETTTVGMESFYILRPEPGWEWFCPQCHEYSLIKESDMPGILKEWEQMATSCKTRGLKIPAQPTAATAGCTNCKYRPGDPE